MGILEEAMSRVTFPKSDQLRASSTPAPAPPPRALPPRDRKGRFTVRSMVRVRNGKVR